MIKNSSEKLEESLSLESYIEVLDGYSLFYFSVLGTRIDMHLKTFYRFGKKPMPKVILSYTYFFQKFIRRFLELSRLPLLALPLLKNLVLSSSELFPSHREDFLEQFERLLKEYLPEVEQQLENGDKKTLLMFGQKTNKMELHSHIVMLRGELETILKEGRVTDRLIKYDLQARS